MNERVVCLRADLPSVLSGDRLQVIDPHQKFFRTPDGQKSSGYRWHLVDKRKQMLTIADQFQPYQGLFGCSSQTFADGFYDGTMFRFPLRQAPSALSDTVYSSAKVEALFESFAAGAGSLLLFLKQLHSVRLLRRANGAAAPRKVFTVRLADECRNDVSQKRQQFTRMIQEKPRESFDVSYLLVIETIRYDVAGAVRQQERHRWLIHELYAGGVQSRDFRALCDDTQLGYIPIVGTAMSCEGGESQAAPDCSAAAATAAGDEKPTGQVFCFLPLAVEQGSSTGLPVHVNGYFAVSQNRHHLKWPTAGSDFRADKSLLWNHCLLTEALPRCYASLIGSAIAYSRREPTELDAAAVYRALPSLVQVDAKWMLLLEPLFAQLLTTAMFRTLGVPAAWRTLQECVIDCLKERDDVRASVIHFLLSVGVHVCKPPPHVMYALGAFSEVPLETVEPELVRSYLHASDSYTRLSRQHKLSLLLFISKDEAFEQLERLQLLPVADASFARFGALGVNPVYICSESCPRTLFPGLEHRLLADLDDDVLRAKLIKIANQGISAFFFWQLTELMLNVLLYLSPCT